MTSQIADSTVRIECGDARGSGFHFLRPEIVVTNHHVVEDDPDDAVAFAEDGRHWPLRLLAYDDQDGYDFAIYEIGSTIPRDRPTLVPGDIEMPSRGTLVEFAGFPHGIVDLLVQRGTVAGFDSEDSFYIDASVNAGNSGGSVTDVKTGAILGMIYASRFLGANEMTALAEQARQLEQHARGTAAHGKVVIFGIDFGKFAALVGASMQILHRSIEANANTGIGIAYPIQFVLEKCAELGVKPGRRRK
jgi:Trypsin-like peptidase domain